jgi:hypothetical protein
MQYPHPPTPSPSEKESCRIWCMKYVKNIIFIEKLDDFKRDLLEI